MSFTGSRPRVVPLFGSAPTNGTGRNGAVLGFNHFDHHELGAGAGAGSCEPGSTGGGAAAASAAGSDQAGAAGTQASTPHNRFIANVTCLRAIACGNIALSSATSR